MLYFQRGHCHQSVWKSLTLTRQKEQIASKATWIWWDHERDKKINLRIIDSRGYNRQESFFIFYDKWKILLYEKQYYKSQSYDDGTKSILSM